MEGAITNVPRPSSDAVLRLFSWRVLVGLGAGGIAGFAVGGIGGRLAMLLLRLTSPPDAIGVISDDGFEIGVVSSSSITFAFQMTMIGGINGVLYAGVRTVLPGRLRLPLWTAFGAMLGGANVVHEDGVDFTVLEPALLAIVLFALLPGVASALVVVLAERWSEREPWSSRSLTTGLAVAALASSFAIVIGAVAVLLAVALSLVRPVGRFVLAAGRIAVPVLLAAITVAAAVALLRESSRILG